MTVRFGNRIPADATAALTLSLASRIAASGSPDSLKASFWRPMWASTSTALASPPTSATDVVAAYMEMKLRDRSDRN